MVAKKDNGNDVMVFARNDTKVAEVKDAGDFYIVRIPKIKGEVVSSTGKSILLANTGGFSKNDTDLSLNLVLTKKKTTTTKEKKVVNSFEW